MPKTPKRPAAANSRRGRFDSCAFAFDLCAHALRDRDATLRPSWRGVLAAIQLRFNLSAAHEARSHWLSWTMVFQFGVAIYGGYFGAGIGILMLASLGFIGLTDIHEMNALKTVLGSLIHVVATIVFIHAGLVDWTKAGVMTIGAFAGYYVGSHFAQRIPQARVRQIITAVGFLIAGWTFYKEFLS